jgi:flagellar biosynthesis regulator FlaF
MYSRKQINEIVRFVSLLCSGMMRKADVKNELDKLPEELRQEILSKSIMVLGVKNVLS